MNNPLISVIVPVYKVEPYLERCLDSVINNTYKNIEIICVNDGSPDNCQVILEKYAVKDSRIKLIVQDNRGLSAARNTGIDSASGDYLYFLDSDDWIHRQALEFLVIAAWKSGADIIIGGYKEVSTLTGVNGDESLQMSNSMEIINLEDYVNSKRYRAMVWGSLYKFDKVKGIRFPDAKRVSEDNLYHILVLSQTKNISVASLPIPLYYYYLIRSDSLTKTATADVLMRNAKWLAEHLHYLDRKKFAIDSILSFMFTYSYESRFYANPLVAKKNINICFQKIHRSFYCGNLSKKTLMKAFVVRYMRFFHRKIMITKDKSRLYWEQNNSSKYKNVYLLNYLDL